MDLKNKTVLFLGSSVTFGSASGGISFADQMAEICGLKMVKEALSGTTLADIDDGSYVARLKKVDRTVKMDLVIVQLSTNDAGRGIPLADTEAAIRFIADYVKATWGCPMVFYTGTYFDSKPYAAMVALLRRLAGEYGFAILDLWDDPSMRSVSEADYKRYMSDPIHPNLTGYRQWWTPKFIAFCEAL